MPERPAAARRAVLLPSSCLVALLAGMVIAGCGQRHEGPSSQTAVLVNQQEVSVHQLQHLMQRQSPAGAEGADKTTRRVLDGLVEQELAAQAARSAGLDKDPRFVQALEFAKREMLARAYQDRLAERAVGASSDAVDRYYDAHPALFAQRRLYTLQETAVQAEPAVREKLRQLARSARDPREFNDVLRGAVLSPRTRQFVQSAEDLPMGLVDVLARFEDGQSIVLAAGDTTRIVTLLRYQVAPLDKRAAKGAIEAHLGNEQRRRLVAEGMKGLRDKASIEYAAAFAGVATVVANTPERAASGAGQSTAGVSGAP